MDILKTFLLQNEVNGMKIKQEPALEIESEVESSEVPEEIEKLPSIRKKYRKLHAPTTFTCDLCNKVFKRNFSLKIHKRIHFDEKPFKCELCSMDFNQKSNYTKHKLIHLNQKPHKCTKCDNTFSQKSHLLNHEMIHTAEDIKPFKCGYCEERFSNNNCLMKHVQVLHFGREMFKCEFCNRIFVSKSGIKNHRRNHLREDIILNNNRKRLDKFMIEPQTGLRVEPELEKNTKPNIVKIIKTTQFELPKQNYTKFGVPNACPDIFILPEIKKEPNIEIIELSDSDSD